MRTTEHARGAGGEAARQGLDKAPTAGHQLTTRVPAVVPILLAMLLLLVGDARGGESMPVTLANLEVAVQARVDAVASAPAPSKSESKEAKALGKALEILTAYNALMADGDHDEDQVDLKNLTKLAKLIGKAKTADAAVLSQAAAVGERLTGVGGHHRERLLELQEFMMEDEHKTPLDKPIEAGNKRLAKWQARWDKKGSAGAKGLLSAIKQYAKGLAVAQEFRQAEAEAHPNDLSLVFADALPILVDGVPQDVQAGHPLRMRARVHCTNFTPVLTVAFRATLKEGVATNQIQEYLIGEVTARDVPAGDHEFFGVSDTGIEFVVPADVLSGDYYLMAEVDPHDRVLELDTSSSTTPELNNFRIDLDQSLRFSDTDVDCPNRVLMSAEYSPEMIYLVDDPTIDAKQTIFGIDVDMALFGTVDVQDTAFTVGIRVYDLPGGFQDFAGEIWDEATETYQPTYTLATAVPGHNTFHVDVRFPGLLGLSVLGGMSVSNLQLEIVQDGSLGECGEFNNKDGDSLFVAGPQVVTMGIAPELAPCSFFDSFEKTIGNAQFGAKLELSSGLDFTKEIDGGPFTDPHLGQSPIQSLAEAGAVASTVARIDVKVLGTPLELVKFRTYGERDPFQNYSYFGIDLCLLGKCIYVVPPVDTPSLNGGKTIALPSGLKLLGDGGFEYTVPKPPKSKGDKKGDDDGGMGGDDDDEEPSFSLFGKAPPLNVWFFPGGIPIRVQNQLEGEYGFKLTFKAANGLTAKAGPIVEWKDSLTAGVCLGPLCAGAGGELTLIQDEFAAILGAGMTPLPDPKVDPNPDARSIDVATCFQVANKITMASGDLFLFADYPWCDFWFGVPYNCGIKRAKLILLSWPGFSWTQIIFKTPGQALCCVKVSGDLECPADSSTVCDL